MNRPFVRWLLDLDIIPDDATGLRFMWQHHWPLWAWVLLTLAALLFAAWSYSRLTGRVLPRGLLATARFLITLMLLVLLAGPMIELPRETEEPDYAVMLLDRSESMNVGDLGDAENRISRDRQLRDLLSKHASMFERLEENRRVIWLGFHSGVFDLAAAENQLPVDPGAATGKRTSLDRALEQALRRVAGRQVSGIVLFTDGRTTEPPSSGLLRRLRAEAVRLYALPLGSHEPAADLAVGRVDLPRRAFIRDEVPVSVQIQRPESTAGFPGGVVSLVDELTGEILDEVDLPAGELPGRVMLRARPQASGEAVWRVVLDTAREDLIPENNHRLLRIELLDRPLRVLYIEGYPRWEYRYLKNLLVREESIESSVMLLSADRDFAQEGNRPISRLPSTPQELERYDVIVVGDVPASFFSSDQQAMMRNHVAGRGAGLLWIGGERSTPRSFAGSALADLLPLAGSLELPRAPEPVNMQPTALAVRLGVLRLSGDGPENWPAALSDPSYVWSQLHWAQQIEPGRLKPAAEVLAHSAHPIGGVHLPLVITMRYGAGQSIYLATDEIWRWRFGRGERLPEQFWVQLIRMLGRESISGTGQRAELTVNPVHAAVGQPLHIELRLLDAQLGDPRRTGVTAVLEDAAATEVIEVELPRADSGEERYVATWLPELTGDIRIKLADPTLTDLNLEASAQIFAPDDELRRPETDHALLRSLVQATGGQMLSDRNLPALPELLPNRSVKTLNPLRETIWDTPLAFALLLVVLTAEWTGRKVVHLT
ncbi:MAG: hypothetical protein JSV91_00955 [Phycisphaerales bacterium]|nr:MAG: hypothetical protein JSV91_00955 [Phycisphaerales bacterium]